MTRASLASAVATFDSDQCRHHLSVLDAEGAAPPSNRLFAAESDAEAVRRFLREYADSPNTLRSYRKELERLLLWCRFVARKRFAELTRDDIDTLREFLKCPPADWVSNARTTRYSGDWRPFRGPLRAGSLRHAELVFNSLFAYLVDARFLEANPFNLVRRRARATQPAGALGANRARRHQLGDSALRCAFEWIDALPESSPALLVRKRRFHAVFSLYLLTGARRTELATATSGHLEHNRDRWWLHIIGKGQKAAALPMGRAAMAALADYRAAMGLPPYPTPNEDTPLFAHLDDPRRAISDDMVYRLVKVILGGAAEMAAELGDQAASQMLASASLHWLRHTAVGRTVAETNDLVLAQQLARHASINTTAIYSTVADDQLHDRATEALDRAIGSAMCGVPSPGNTDEVSG